MKLRQTTLLLIILLVFVLLAKIFVLTGVENPSYDSYFGMRQIDNIKQTGLPLIDDDLSYQGRTNNVDFVFYYMLAFFSIFIPLKLLFMFGGVLVTLASLILIFLVSRKLYANRWIALIVTTIGGLSTVLFSSSLASLSPTSFFVLIYLGIIYAFITFAKTEANVALFIVLAIIGTLLTSLMLILLIGFIFYLVLLKLEKISTRKKELEVLGFTGIFILWYHLVIYRKLFQLYGAGSLWNSIPRELVSSFFQRISLPIIVLLIGVIPFILGLYAMYNSLFTQRRRYLLLLTSLSLSFVGLLFLGLIPVADGLLLTTINFILLSGFALKQLNTHFKKMNHPKVKYLLVAGLIVLALINFIPTVLSGVNLQTPSLAEEELLSSLSLPEGVTILANVKEGHFISYTTNRKNFYDEKFVLAPQPNQRYKDAKTIFLSTSKTKALSLLNYYNIRYIYLSDLTINENAVANYVFTDDPCFKLIGEIETARLYEVRCTLSN